MKESKQDTPTQPTEHAKRAATKCHDDLFTLNGDGPIVDNNTLDDFTDFIQRDAIDPAVAEVERKYSRGLLEYRETLAKLCEFMDRPHDRGKILRNKARALLDRYPLMLDGDAGDDESARKYREALETVVDALSGLVCSSAPKFVVDGIALARGTARRALLEGGTDAQA